MLKAVHLIQDWTYVGLPRGQKAKLHLTSRTHFHVTQVASHRHHSEEACIPPRGHTKVFLFLRLGLMKADSMGLFGAWLIDMLQTFGLAACQGDKKGRYS